VTIGAAEKGPRRRGTKKKKEKLQLGVLEKKKSLYFQARRRGEKRRAGRHFSKERWTKPRKKGQGKERGTPLFFCMREPNSSFTPREKGRGCAPSLPDGQKGLAQEEEGRPSLFYLIREGGVRVALTY